ncbi:hypothetical protein [Solemya velum gill symbiont]|uniref:hypothetical protein n=1 Tax=Solemya velum gill symbiont TaxID=2340 RepID=UPI000997C584|nr:hypothetical protein [Solemya velum gill symbiont]OOY37353.1 hypothetical protein BOV89_08175 [Solemya velum gill symbiont]OOY42648.1 hypothetical protein BOV92_13120 [Solemya velum gill symbiont]OOY49082.1 hypothetical protein BOV94_12485 [Solemya velum gill symbiont]
MKFINKAWQLLEDFEESTKNSTSFDLKEWNEIVKSTIEAGAMVSMLKAKNHGQQRILSAAPFLKRSLTDLRSVWLLIQIGYTSQAASVTASLYENALTASVLAYSDQLAQEALSTKYSEIPWGAKKLAQLSAEIDLKRSFGNDDFPKDKYEGNWTVSYFGYKWLCQIKHPTWQSAFHDVKSSLVNEKDYVIFPAPCNKKEDLHLKFAVLGDAVGKTIAAIRSYCLSLECEEDNEEYKLFEDKLSASYLGVIEQMKKYADKTPPVNVIDRRFIKIDPHNSFKG